MKIDSASWRRQKEDEGNAEAVGITEVGVPRFARFKVRGSGFESSWVTLQGGGFWRIKLRLLARDSKGRVWVGLNPPGFHLQGEDFGGLS